MGFRKILVRGLKLVGRLRKRDLRRNAVLLIFSKGKYVKTAKIVPFDSLDPFNDLFREKLLRYPEGYIAKNFLR